MAPATAANSTTSRASSFASWARDAPKANRTLSSRAPGYFADIVIFDPGTIADTAMNAKLQQYAVGIDAVMVNGQITVRNRQHTGSRAGHTIFGSGIR